MVRLDCVRETADKQADVLIPGVTEKLRHYDTVTRFRIRGVLSLPCSLPSLPLSSALSCDTVNF